MDWDNENQGQPDSRRLILEGLRLLRNKQLGAAMDTWKEAIAADPFNQEALFYLKEAFKEKDRKRILANLLGTSMTQFKKKDYKQTLLHALMIRGIEADNTQAIKLILMARDGLLDDLKPLPAYDRMAEEYLDLMKKAEDASPFRRTAAKAADSGEVSLEAARKAIMDNQWETAYSMLSRLIEDVPDDPELQDLLTMAETEFMKILEEKFRNLQSYPSRTGKDLFDSDLKDWDVEEIYIFTLINGKRSLGQICSLVSRGKQKVLVAINQFQNAGLVTLSEIKTA